MTSIRKWAGIPQLPRAHYEIDAPWHGIEEMLAWFGKTGGLTIDPDYQREHVWSEEQQRAYVEYVLMGGEVGKNITWNSTDWPDCEAPIELVDGKQRLTAVRKFIAGDLTAFGLHYEPGDLLRIHQITFKFRICSLSRADVLRLYLNINAGGTPHTAEEIERVRALLEKEQHYV